MLEALAFDFVVGSPHADLVDLFDASEADALLQDYAWSIAHDSFVFSFLWMFNLANFTKV